MADEKPKSIWVGAISTTFRSVMASSAAACTLASSGFFSCCTASGMMVVIMHAAPKADSRYTHLSRLSGR